MKLSITFIFLLWLCAINAQKLTDSLAFTAAAWETKTISAGVLWRHFQFTDSAFFNARENINVVSIAKNITNIRWAFGSACDSLTPTSTLARKSGALVALNGSFFDVKKGGAVDFIKINGAVLDTTRHNGKKLAEHQQSALAFVNNTPLILQARDSLDWAWQNTFTDYQNVMVTGPWLLRAGEKNNLVSTPFNKNRHPRSGVCFSDKAVMLITVDGRTSESYGVNLDEFATLMRWLGCSDGINLDGGGSTTLYVKDEPFKGVVNMPCDNKKFDHEGERAVSNVIMLLPE